MLLFSDVPSKLKPFVFQRPLSEDEEFALVTLKNPILIGSHLVGSYPRTTSQVNKSHHVRKVSICV